MAQHKRSRPNYAPTFLATVWEHWRSYEASGGEDTDELTALLELAERSHVGVMIPVDDDSDRLLVEDWLPVLLSVATYLLGDDDKSTTTAAQRAIRWWPHNLAAWCDVLQDRSSSSHRAAAAYRWVAQQARLMRTKGLEWRTREAESNASDDAAQSSAPQQQQPPVLESIDTLFLYHGLGVERCMDDSDDEAEADDIEDLNDDSGNGGRSTSIVEATARTMAATLFSLAGQHESAAEELRYMECTHRLHPNVWNATIAVNNNDAPIDLLSEPAVFAASPVLPTELFEQLAQVFAPSAPFWTESNYDQRGYYSFYIPRLSANAAATDLIQDVIESYLLPLLEANLEQKTSPDDEQRIVGYEWWVHTRPVAAHLGHNLHFDSDETLLNEKGNVSHPLVSSVLYLDAAQGAGPTIVLDQTSEEQTETTTTVGDREVTDQRVWRNEPNSNSYLVFPGNLLHGVLPCCSAGPSAESSDTTGTLRTSVEGFRTVSDMMAQFSEKGANDPAPPKVDDQKYRTSFMVGYWTSPRGTNIQSSDADDNDGEDDDLYGPCFPLPPASHSWVADIQKGYPRATSSTTAGPAPRPTRLPSVTPAWQLLEKKGKEEDSGDQLLPIPPAVDHLYFVTDPRNCFRERLFSHL